MPTKDRISAQKLKGIEYAICCFHSLLISGITEIRIFMPDNSAEWYVGFQSIIPVTLHYILFSVGLTEERSHEERPKENSEFGL